MTFYLDVWTTLQIIHFYSIDVYPQEVMDGYKPLWIGLSVLCILVIFLVIDFVWLKLSRKGKNNELLFRNQIFEQLHHHKEKSHYHK